MPWFSGRWRRREEEKVRREEKEQLLPFGGSGGRNRVEEGVEGVRRKQERRNN